MVAPQDEHLLGVLYLQREQQADGLQSLPPSVDVIPQEEVGGLGREAAVLEQPQHVVVLSVDVPADLDRRGHLHQHRLLHEDALGRADQPQDVRLPQLDELARLGRPHLQQRADYLVHVHLHLRLHQQLI